MESHPTPDDFAALTERVAALERQLAALQLARPPMPQPEQTFHPLPVPLQRFMGEPPSAIHVSDPQPPPKPTQSLETRLGAQLFNRIGIVAILFAAAWFLKLAIEHNWINPVARSLIGLLSGAAIILFSERLRRRDAPAFAASLKALGTGILYLTLWAAFQLYHLLPAPAVLAAMLLVAAWNAFMAWSQSSELLAAYALLGAFLTPLLLSTGGDHETFLFTYVASIDLATILLVRVKPWPRLAFAALLGTIAYFIAWYVEFFVHPNLTNNPFTLTLTFLLIFAALFALPTVRAFLTTEPAERSQLIPLTLLPIANAAFLSLALYSIFQDTNRHALLPWLMAALAALYLILTRLQRNALYAALHLAFAVLFLTVAIPLKASGHTLTIAWLVEGLVLLWVSTRIPQPTGPNPANPLLASSSVLRFLSFAGYTLGLLAILFTSSWYHADYLQPFLNADLAAAITGVAVFAGAAYLGLKPILTTQTRPIAWLHIAISDFLAIDTIAILLTARELAAYAVQLHPACASPDFFTALTGLAILATTLYALSRLIASAILIPLRPIAALTAILFNLLLILTVERELSTLFPRHTANLQRSLAISGFLILYAAALLTLGFVRRSAFTRWQALILLLFTILKVFLYDTSTLAQGYRVASFLLLGVVLMTISFAYQRDWLHLREPAASTEPS